MSKTAMPNAPITAAVFSAADPADRVTPETVGEAFPIKTRRCYLNNASIGPMPNPVFGATQGFLEDVRDNGRNNYPLWCIEADTAIKDRIARLIGASRSEIAFIKNTTEGLVIVANGIDWREGDNVVIPDIEYPSNVYCWMHLAKRGVSVRWVKSENGRVPVDALAAAMDSRTRLVSISAVQFSNGFRHDLAATSELCKAHGALLNVDAIQWVGVLQLDLADLGIDFLSVGGQKWLLAPIGTGLFYCSARALDRLDPPNVGYHTVDKGEAHLDYALDYRPDAGRFEEALVNFPGIWGLDAAVRMQLALGPAWIESHIAGLVQRAADGLKRKGWTILSSERDGERSGILSFTHHALDVEAEAGRLREAGVDLAVRAGALRISPSYYNDAAEIDRLVETLPTA